MVRASPNIGLRARPLQSQLSETMNMAVPVTFDGNPTEAPARKTLDRVVSLRRRAVRTMIKVGFGLTTMGIAMSATLALRLAKCL